MPQTSNDLTLHFHHRQEIINNVDCRSRSLKKKKKKKKDFSGRSACSSITRNKMQLLNRIGCDSLYGAVA
ncbi:hypothetical protein PUN28_002993 [Cardiocondyla obscurior]|uniref:Uncharacterized protein n=1 Tax=Cardiocondyla obscurior TaxID=286306 RepID=A0AAW2GX32_9HYME